MSYDLISYCVGGVIHFFGQVISAIIGGSWKNLLPVIGLSISAMFVIFAIRIVKSLIKGY